MPVPAQYQRATDDFYAFLVDARDQASLQTTNQSYTMVQGVLQTFRRRLSLADAVRFAGVLPAVVRAVFVSDWDPDEPQRPFADRVTLAAEVRALRPNHNFSPDTAIHDVAVALRKHVDVATFDRMLAALPEGAADFWRV
jgi:uncharacterized protein (DUF2267 family)